MLPTHVLSALNKLGPDGADSAHADPSSQPLIVVQGADLNSFSIVLAETLDAGSKFGVPLHETPTQALEVNLSGSTDPAEGEALTALAGKFLPVTLAAGPENPDELPTEPVTEGVILSAVSLGASPTPRAVPTQRVDSPPPAVSTEVPALVLRGGAPPAAPPIATPGEVPEARVQASLAPVLPAAEPPPALPRAGAEIAAPSFAVSSSSASPFEASGSAVSGVASSQLTTPLHHRQWSDAFAQRVSWLVKDGTQVASLRLNPPSLGAVEVRISVAQGEASIAFGASHELAREAIENALPRLRHMLGGSGLNLVDVNVSNHSANQDGAQHGGFAAPGEASNLGGQPALDESDEEGPAAPISTAHRGLIDQYA